MLTDDFNKFAEQLLEAVTSMKKLTYSNIDDWRLKKENLIQTAYITNELTLKVKVNENLLSVENLYKYGYLIYSLHNGCFLAYELVDGKWSKEIPVGLNGINMKLEGLIKNLLESKY